MIRRFPGWAPWVAGGVGGLALLIGQFGPVRDHVERSLTERVESALADAGYTAAEVSFSGRDGTVTVPTDDGRIEAIAEGVTGVRVAHVRAAEATLALPSADETDATDDASDDATDPATEDATEAATEDATEAATDDATDATAEELAELQQVTFATSSATILGRSGAVLDAMATSIMDGPVGNAYEVQGHTDTVGDAEGNRRLSQARADAVRSALIERGVDPERLTAVGFGEERLLVSPEKTAKDRAANRRVVVIPVF